MAQPQSYSSLETIGITTVMGSVLGASTLSFADQPGHHLLNIVYGALIGAAAGTIYVASRDDSSTSASATDSPRNRTTTLDGEMLVSLPLVSLRW